MKIPKIICSFAVVLTLTACSSIEGNLPSNDKLLKDYTKQDGRECIRESDIRGFGVLDKDIISVSARVRKEYYLMTTIYQCQSLDTSFQLAFAGSFSEFCGGGSSKVKTSDEDCPIKGIYVFDSREKAFEAHDAITKIRDALKEELQNN